MKSFTIYLKQWRVYKGLKQTQLSIKSGLTQAAISNIENAQREITSKSILRLAKALDISPEQLFSLPPVKTGKLDRYDIDDLAKHIISGIPYKDPIGEQICKNIASLIIHKLKAHKKNGTKRNIGKRWNTQSRYVTIKEKYPKPIVEQILHRVDKLLPGANNEN